MLYSGLQAKGHDLYGYQRWHVL